MNDALYGTLQVFAKTLGIRQVVEICQRFILDSIPVPVPVAVPEAEVQTVVKKFKVIKLKLPSNTETPVPVVAPVVKTAKKITPVVNRNFKKMAQQTHFIPFGTQIITSETDKNPAIVGTVVRTSLGAPAIQPAWDKTKFFSGTSSPPAMFLKEATKHFKIMSSKPLNTRNAWDDVYKRNTDGTNISLADLWKQTVS